MRHYFVLVLGLLGFLFSACNTARVLPRKAHKTLHEYLGESPVLSKSYTGFALFDPEEGQMLFQQYGDRYFTPASNTKIFTLFATLKILQDSLPVIHYQTSNDTLVFWGTGNPATLHQRLPEDPVFISFFQDKTQQLFYSDASYLDERLGDGWAWDDYKYYYQTEKSGLPLYINNAVFQRFPGEERPSLTPDRLELEVNPNHNSKYAYRKEHNNNVVYNPRVVIEDSMEQFIPMRYDPKLWTGLLRDTIGRPIKYWRGDSLQAPVRTLSQVLPDTLLRRFMQDSDNFIAEQLLLTCSDKLFGVQQTEKAIEYVKDSLLANSPDQLVWVDGSGLSRYNMFTPRSVIYVLDQIRKEIPQEQLFSIFPAGGVSGTIQNWYGASEPYVFAKTGTLRHNHCLSGYLKTKSGKVLIFSFMHNHYITSSAPLKKEMTKILAYIRDQL